MTKGDFGKLPEKYRSLSGVGVIMDVLNAS